MKRIIFMGQKPIGERCFQLLTENQDENYQVVAAVSNESAENVWWHSAKVREYSLQSGLPFVNSEKNSTEKIIRRIEESHADFIISVGYPWILGKDILALVHYDAVNLHLAKLPDYRGNFTYNHAILNKEKEYGVTLHWMVEAVDRGDYAYTDTFPITEEDTAYSLYFRSLDAGTALFRKLVEQLRTGGKIPRCPMEGEGSFYDRKSLDGLRLINNVADEEEVKKKSRAFYFPPFENAYFIMGGRKYYVIPENEHYE